MQIKQFFYNRIINKKRIYFQIFRHFQVFPGFYFLSLLFPILVITYDLSFAIIIIIISHHCFFNKKFYSLSSENISCSSTYIRIRRLIYFISVNCCLCFILCCQKISKILNPKSYFHFFLKAFRRSSKVIATCLIIISRNINTVIKC